MGADVAIIGGGLIGCATAYYLARGGASVAVFERGRVGEGASYAAAGMLAPLCEAKQPGPFMDLLLAALRDYPDAVADVEAASGLAAGYRPRGILRVAFTEEEESRLEAAACLYDAAGLPYHRLAPHAAREAEPALSADVRTALLSLDEGQVSPRHVTRAFRRAAEFHGARIHEFTEVGALERGPDGVRGVRVSGGTVEARVVVVAAGAWSPLVGADLPAAVPVFPVRGQIVAVRNMPVAVRRVIYSYGGYAVPWGDGRLVLGATMEEAGYAARTTVAGVEKVLAEARRVLPGVREAELDSAWAGLRPGSADGQPLLGPAPGAPGVWLATGHFRNGILLGPYTSRLLAESIRAGRLAETLRPFAPDRAAA